LLLLRKDREARGVWYQRALFDGLTGALGHLKVTELRRVHLDDVCRRWQRVGIEYPERDTKQNPIHPVSPATCAHGMRTLRQARQKAAEDYGLMLPPLSFPTFPDHVAGSYQ